MCRRRAEAFLQRRNEISVRFAKSSSLRAVSRHYFSRVLVEGRVRRVLVGWKIRHGRRDARAARQHRSADDLHALVPFLAASCWWKARLFFLRQFWQAEAWR